MIVTGSCLEATHAFSVSSSALASAMTAVSENGRIDSIMPIVKRKKWPKLLIHD
eukprot:UN07788